MSEEIEPINPEEARRILNNAIVDHLGKDWDDEREGWSVVSGHDYMARVMKGSRMVDFYVDLLGNVTVEEKETGIFQSNARLVAFMMITASLLVALVLARLSGYL